MPALVQVLLLEREEFSFKKEHQGGVVEVEVFSCDSACVSVKDFHLIDKGIAKCLRKKSPTKLYLPKQMGEDQLNDLELDGPITLRMLDGIA